MYWAPRSWYQFEFLFFKFLLRPKINIAAVHVKKHQECNMHRIWSFVHRLNRFHISNKRKSMIFSPMHFKLCVMCSNTHLNGETIELTIPVSWRKHVFCLRNTKEGMLTKGISNLRGLSSTFYFLQNLEYKIEQNYNLEFSTLVWYHYFYAIYSKIKRNMQILHALEALKHMIELNFAED